MAGVKVIQSQEVGIVYFPLQNKTTMTLLNVAYTPKSNSNLILLDQLPESGILYYDHFDSIILKQGESILEVASRYKNLFILKTGLRGKIMLVQGRSPTYVLT